MLWPFGITEKTLNNRETKEVPHDLLGKSPREMAQTLGTEWRRQMVHPDIWLMLAERRYTFCCEREDISGLAITDIRFDNEAKWVKSQGGIIWDVRRDVPGVKTHVSEQGVADCYIDYVIDNNGSLEALTDTVESQLRTIEPTSSLSASI
jgi:hypothetical protein